MVNNSGKIEHFSKFRGGVSFSGTIPNSSASPTNISEGSFATYSKMKLIGRIKHILKAGTQAITIEEMTMCVMSQYKPRPFVLAIWH